MSAAYPAASAACEADDVAAAGYGDGRWQRRAAIDRASAAAKEGVRDAEAIRQ